VRLLKVILRCARDVALTVSPHTQVQGPTTECTLSCTCPLWAKSGRDGANLQCPLFPRKTSLDTVGMSALCHKRTSRLYSITSSSASGNQRTLALQWRIDDRKALLVLLEGDVGDAERFAQLVIRHFHWAR
jgi:hypothetical protein